MTARLAVSLCLAAVLGGSFLFIGSADNPTIPQYYRILANETSLEIGGSAGDDFRYEDEYVLPINARLDSFIDVTIKHHFAGWFFQELKFYWSVYGRVSGAWEPLEWGGECGGVCGDSYFADYPNDSFCIYYRGEDVSSRIVLPSHFKNTSFELRLWVHWEGWALDGWPWYQGMIFAVDQIIVAGR